MPFFSRKKSEIKDTSDQLVGGFAFFLSLSLLLPTGVLFLGVALAQLRESNILSTMVFITALGSGVTIAHYLIKGHLSVLIHEWKHEIVSGLVGNKNKRMEINQHSGSLQYEYTKDTAHYNAFIALAPYILPLFTFFGALLTLATSPSNTIAPLIIIGCTYGIDLMTNARDISPIQTDISLIRGGYYIGLLYILAWNALTTGLALAWAFGGLSGISAQFETLAWIFINLYSFITGWGVDSPT
jgi:hypothetical protein